MSTETHFHRIIVTGSRGWTNRRVIYDTLRQYMAEVLLQPGAHRFIIVHGGAQGADTIAGQFANRHSISEEVHFPKWSLGKRAGLARNAEMVQAGAEVVFAFWDGTSRGTRHCITLAERAGVEVRVVTPDG